MKDSRRLQEYLEHILKAIERIDTYIEDLDEVGFLESMIVQDAVIRNFEVIGEACRNIDKHFPSFSQQHPDIPLSFAYEMRNVLAHGYFKVDLDIVWKSIGKDLPQLHKQIKTILSS